MVKLTVKRFEKINGCLIVSVLQLLQATEAGQILGGSYKHYLLPTTCSSSVTHGKGAKPNAK